MTIPPVGSPSAKIIYTRAELESLREAPNSTMKPKDCKIPPEIDASLQSLDQHREFKIRSVIQ